MKANANKQTSSVSSVWTSLAISSASTCHHIKFWDNCKYSN